MCNFLLLIVIFYFLKLFFHSTIIYFVFPCCICSANFLAMFYVSTKSCLISISFFPTNTAYANTFSCSLPIFIPLGTICIPCITCCNANMDDRQSPCFSPVLFSKQEEIFNFFKHSVLYCFWMNFESIADIMYVCMQCVCLCVCVYTHTYVCRHVYMSQLCAGDS